MGSRNGRGNLCTLAKAQFLSVAVFRAVFEPLAGEKGDTDADMTRWPSTEV